jgi:hypothetical protein
VSALVAAAFVQLGTMVAFFVLGAVGMRLGRYSLGTFGWLAATFFALRSIVNYERSNPGFDFSQWANSGGVVLVHNLLLFIFLCAVIAELVIREVGRE